VRLEEGEQGLQVLPVGAIVAGEKDRGLKAKGVGLADVVADVLEVLNIIQENLTPTRSMVAR
jgi:hypothetical protein